MTPTKSGWLLFIAAIGMMCGLLYTDVAKLTSWWDATTPSFIAQVMFHFSTVVLAFIGGRLIPTSSNDK